jgi:hypothetical protein
VLTLPTAGVWTPGNWQVDMVVTPLVIYSGDTTWRRLFDLFIDANNYYAIVLNPSNGKLFFELKSGGVNYSMGSSLGFAWSAIQPLMLTTKGNGSNASMIVNGVIFASPACVEPVGVLPTSMFFGCYNNKTGFINAIFEHIRIGTARLDADTIASHAVTSNPFPVDSLTTAKIDFNAITYRQPKVVNL